MGTPKTPYENIPDWYQKIIDSAEKFRHSTDSIIAITQTAAQSKGSIINQILRSVDRTADTFRGLQKSGLFSLLEEIAENVRKLPIQTQEALILLGQHSWYVDLEMSLPQVWRLRDALSNGNVAEAERALVTYYEGRIEMIEQSMGIKFPKRKKLLKAAFNAHKRQEYELSIPVLLAQTDGICNDAIKEYLFEKYNKKPRTAIYVSGLNPDSITAAFLSPLAQNLPIGQSKTERGEDFDGLNRHMVLHGESLDYGTKVNSLKAVSLINYVAQVLAKYGETLAPH